VTKEEFRQDWVGTFSIGGLDEANTLFDRADVNDDGVIDAQDIPQIFAYFDENGTLNMKAETIASLIYLLLSYLEYNEYYLLVIYCYALQTPLSVDGTDLFDIIREIRQQVMLFFRPTYTPYIYLYGREYNSNLFAFL